MIDTFKKWMSGRKSGALNEKSSPKALESHVFLIF